MHVLGRQKVVSQNNACGSVRAEEGDGGGGIWQRNSRLVRWLDARRRWCLWRRNWLH